MSHPLHRQVYSVRFTDLGPLGSASLAAVCNLLQESAILHAHELELSPEHLSTQGIAWFLNRLDLRIDRYPRWRDAVTVETWPSELFGLLAMRQFRIFDDRQEQLAVASTAWLLIDVARRKPLRRIPQALRDIHSHEPVRVLPRNPPPLPAVEACEHQERFRVRLSDLDMNGHVNNVIYVAKIAQAVPPEVWKARQVEELQIEFRAECHYGDEVVARTHRLEDGEDTFVHSLVKAEDSKEVARARTSWVDAGATGPA